MYAVVTGAVMIVAAVTAAGIVFRHSWNWGDFPSWIIAITTTLAFAAAAIAARVTYRLYKVEAGRDETAAGDREARREAERRVQANKVAAWFHSEQDAVSGTGKALLVTWGAVVRNASDLPVLDVKVTFSIVQDLGTKAPWQPVQAAGLLERIIVIPPGDERFIAIPDEIGELAAKIGSDSHVVSIEFSDAAGNRWERNPRGVLIDLSARPVQGAVQRSPFA